MGVPAVKSCSRRRNPGALTATAAPGRTWAGVATAFATGAPVSPLRTSGAAATGAGVATAAGTVGVALGPLPPQATRRASDAHGNAEGRRRMVATLYRRGYSDRKASIGSRCAACHAG